MAELFAGASGFAYKSWKPGFYPADLPATRFLEHYASRLNAVEINYTFRRNPSPAAIEKWAAATGEGFRFCFKAPMRITHVLRLHNAGEAAEFFLRSIDPLRVLNRLGAVLFQLPPQFRAGLDRLQSFLDELPRDLRYAFEFRHPSWFDPKVYRALESRNVCLCRAESEKLETPEVMTADFVYLRLRKPNYTAADRRVIQEEAAGLLASGKDVFLFFKHEETPEGALYAEEMLRTTAQGERREHGLRANHG